MRKLLHIAGVPSMKVGDKFSQLILVRLLPKRGNYIFGLFMCDCGGSSEIRLSHVKSGQIKSCGCLLEKHGMSREPIYKIWAQMKQRCSSSDPRFYRYNGRGISFCERWRDFKNFYEDMGASYKKGLYLDRINNDGNYEPSNCRWLTPFESCRNKCDNRFLTIKGVTKVIADLVNRVWCS